MNLFIAIGVDEAGNKRVVCLYKDGAGYNLDWYDPSDVDEENPLAKFISIDDALSSLNNHTHNQYMLSVRILREDQIDLSQWNNDSDDSDDSDSSSYDDEPEES